VKINVCFTIDNKYAEYCAVTIASILINSDCLFYFYILHSGLSTENKNKLERLKNIKDFAITFVEVDLKYFDKCYLPDNAHFNIVAYFRLKIPSLMPDVDKIIYLDADIIAIRDLKALWDISFDDFHIVGCKSMTHRRNCERLGLPPGTPYINSGVMVLNLWKMRENKIEEKYFEYIMNHDTSVLNNPDQDIINLILVGVDRGIKQTRQNWNTEVRTDIQFEEEYLPIVHNPFIIHFITADKPWNTNSKQLYREKYLQYRHISQKSLFPKIERLSQSIIQKIFRKFY